MASINSAGDSGGTAKLSSPGAWPTAREEAWRGGGIGRPDCDQTHDPPMAIKVIDKMAVGEDLAIVWLARFKACDGESARMFLR